MIRKKVIQNMIDLLVELAEVVAGLILSVNYSRMRLKFLS